MLRDILHTELFVTVNASKSRSTTLVHMLACVNVTEESMALCTDKVHEWYLASTNELERRPHTGEPRES